MARIKNYRLRNPRYAIHTIDQNVTPEQMGRHFPGVDYLQAGDSYITWGETARGDEPRHLVLLADSEHEALGIAEQIRRDYALPVDITDGEDWAEGPDFKHPAVKGWAEWVRTADALPGECWEHLIRVSWTEELNEEN